MESYITLTRASDMVPGDFLDEVDAGILRGPRGGKYRFDGVSVESRVLRCGWVDELNHARGFRVVPTTGPAFIIPGNAADLVGARVRRSIAASSVQFAEDDQLLELLDSPERAVAVAAEAELNRRTLPRGYRAAVELQS